MPDLHLHFVGQSGSLNPYPFSSAVVLVGLPCQYLTWLCRSTWWNIEVLTLGHLPNEAKLERMWSGQLPRLPPRSSSQYPMCAMQEFRKSSTRRGCTLACPFQAYSPCGPRNCSGSSERMAFFPSGKDRRVLTAALESLEDFILWKADDLGRTSAQSRAAASTCSLMISTPFSSLFLAKAIHLWRTRQLSYAVLWQVYQSRQSPSFWRWTTNLWNASSKTSRLPVISTSGRRRKPSSKQSEMGWCRGWRGWCGQGSGDGSEKGSLGAVGRPRGTWTSRHTSAFQAFSQDNCQSITWTRSNHQARLEACGQEVPWGKRCHFAYWWS